MIKTKNTKKMEEEVAGQTHPWPTGHVLACACVGFLQVSVEERGRHILDN
jgi:hypothetical protein